jgi:ATP-dependent RNA helicase DeaD
MPPRIVAIAKRHLRDPVQIRIARDPLPEGAVPLVRQTAYIVSRAHKAPALARVLDMENPEAALIFCRTRNEVDELTETMNAHGYRTEALHGGMAQEQRDRVMKKLRTGAADLIIATDVAARGLDIARLTHVINYDVPNAPDAYIHRIGRVGRAGREGVAITLAEPREHRLLRNIEQLTKRKIEVGQVPTVADLRARRMELVRASLRETLLAGELDRFRVIVEALSDEFDPMDIAMAAIKMAQEATGADGDAAGEDIPAVSPQRDEPPGGRPARGKPRGDRDARGGEKGARGGHGGRGRGGPGMEGGVARIYVGAGRAMGIRPQDLVGAITGEAGVTGREIGAIHITEKFAIVEVAEDVAGDVIAALRGAKIKGKKVPVRRDRAKA